MILTPKIKLYTPEGFELALWDEEMTWEVEFDVDPGFYFYHALHRTPYNELDQVLKAAILK